MLVLTFVLFQWTKKIIHAIGFEKLHCTTFIYNVMLKLNFNYENPIFSQVYFNRFLILRIRTIQRFIKCQVQMSQYFGPILTRSVDAGTKNNIQYITTFSHFYHGRLISIDTKFAGSAILGQDGVYLEFSYHYSKLM